MSPSGSSPGTLVPSRATSLPAIVFAPASVTCWPMIARTPVSNGSHVPGGRRPGRASSKRTDGRVARELDGRLREIEVEAADPAGALHDVDELVPVRQVRAQEEVVVAAGSELEHAGPAADDDRSPVGVALDRLDAWDGAGGEVRGQVRPVERAAVREAQEQAAVRDETIRLATAGPQLAGRLAEDLLAGTVELAQAAEPGRERDLGHGQVGVVEEPTREVDPGRARQPVRRHAQLLLEEPAQVAGRDTEPRAEVGLARVIEGAVHDQAYGAADELRSRPGHGSAASGTGGSACRPGTRRPRPRLRAGNVLTFCASGCAPQPGRQ